MKSGILKTISGICLYLFIICHSFFSQSLAGETAERFKPILYKTKTIDGWDIVLKRFKKSRFHPEKTPVVLCHGFNHNDRFWYVDRKYSLAYYLYEKGYDVWLMSLRGSGESTKPGLAELRSLSRFDLLKIPQTLARASLSLNKFNWNIDDHIDKDVPAALELITKETGHEEVNWVGHSLGGMIVYAYIEGGGRGIKNLVAIASPMIIPQPPDDLLAIIRDQRGAVYLSMLINTTVASQLQVVSAGLMKSSFDLLFYNPDNMKKDVMLKVYHEVVEDIAPGAIDQLRVMIAEGNFLSSDRKINYSANLSSVTIPVLCLGGLYDNLAPPMSIYFAYHNISSKDKSIRIFSLANGYSANYGHNDLVLGKRAPYEVYPYIYRWLEKH